MEVILKDNTRRIVRFDKGERLIEGLAAYMEKEGIHACTFSGIGTSSDIELGYYNQHIKDYRRKRYLEDLEIVSLSGSGALFEGDGKPMVHAHGTFSRTDFTTLAGHVFEIQVSATCEVFLIVLDGQMKRKLNTDFNLNLLSP